MIESVSKKTFRGSSGSYNVQALELAAAKVRKLKGLDVTVQFLDDTEHVFHVEKRAKGLHLLELVYRHLELVEKDYFGLQIAEEGSAYDAEFTCWLDPSKQIKKQLNDCKKNRLYFKVKFYVSDPSKLVQEYTRYQFYLQLKKDIIEEKLVLSPGTAILLASYMVQSELGDYQHEDHDPNYISHLRLIPDQTLEIERKIAELHKLHKGKLPADAEFHFLDHVKRMDMYGVELHRALDNTNKDIQLGVTHIGLVVFRNGVKLNTFSWSKITKISFKRKQFFILLRKEASEDYDTILVFNMETYRSCKTLWKSCVEHHTFFRLNSPKAKRRFARKFPFSLGSKFSYSGRTEYQTVSEVQRTSRGQQKFVRSPSKQSIKHTIYSSSGDEKSKSHTIPVRAPRPYDNKVTSLGAKEPRKAWAVEPRLSDDDGGFLDKTLEGPFSPGIAGKVLSYADEDLSPTSNGLYDTPPYSASHSPVLQAGEGSVVTVTLCPDEDGKYGFNIKGGKEKGVLILVNKVVPFSPADKCTPKLTDGDQILQINGQDVSSMLHDEAVNLIQEARDVNSGKLTLTIKPNALYNGHEEYEEPFYQYVPLGNSQRASSPSNALGESMLLLADGLGSGALVANYETLFRKHPDLACEEAGKTKNVAKNRYRDISPYDSTRVILKDNPTGDYINANFVNMTISGTTTTNRYIATQGPLQQTTDDFWQMILEQECSLIVMLTTVIEKGRAKCHKYWPNVGDSLVMPNVILKCTKEESDSCGNFVYRDFLLTDIKKHSEREVKHIQYTAWPDHGVPENPTLFLKFTEEIREARKDESPVVVHCSAGIGRTGVLVLMETALCLIEANEPVYPLEIVKTMREQRAMMIQNASQYLFVCESVYAAYLKKIEKEESEEK